MSIDNLGVSGWYGPLMGFVSTYVLISVPLSSTISEFKEQEVAPNGFHPVLEA